MPVLSLFLHLTCGRLCCAKPECTSSGPSITQRQKDLVTKTWFMVNGDLAAVGDMFYDELFKQAPGLKTTLFKNTDMKTQPKALMQMVDAAVKGLAKPGDLIPVLIASGKRHVAYKTEEAHYPVAAGVVIAILRKALGDVFTAETEEAWNAVLGFVAHYMIEGQRMVTPTVSAKDKEIARKSWAEMKKKCNMKSVGQQYYRRLFELAPTLPSTLFKDVDMEVQPLLVMGMVGQVVEQIDREDLVTYLQESGRRHIKYGTFDAAYAVVKQALLPTMQKNLGKSWTPEVDAAWNKVYDFMAWQMIAGAKASRGE